MTVIDRSHLYNWILYLYIYLIIDCEFYVVINKTDKTLITCLLIFLFSKGNCHFNDIWHFVDWINFIGIVRLTSLKQD